MCTTRAIPRWSPAKVLNPPHRTLLRCSDGNRFFYYLKRLRGAFYIQIKIISNVFFYLLFYMRIFMTLNSNSHLVLQLDCEH